MTTIHVLHHRASSVALELDEDSGQFALRFRSSPLPDPNFRKDLERWAKHVGTGWAKRTGAVAGDRVSLHFLKLKSPKADGFYKGTFKKGQKQ